MRLLHVRGIGATARRPHVGRGQPPHWLGRPSTRYSTAALFVEKHENGRTGATDVLEEAIVSREGSAKMASDRDGMSSEKPSRGR